MTPIRILAVGKLLTEDLMFWENLARGLAASAQVPTIVVHRAGEMAERILEGDGLDAGRVLETGKPAGALEAALRRENRQVTLTLTDHGVASVGFLGVDRGMLRWTQSGLEARLGVLAGSARIGVVPILCSLALEEMDPSTGTVGTRPARKAPPTLAEIIESAHKQTDFPPFWVGWMATDPLRATAEPGNVREWSGESRLPSIGGKDPLSIRILGVSDVAQGDAEAGAALES